MRFWLLVGLGLVGGCGDDSAASGGAGGSGGSGGAGASEPTCFAPANQAGAPTPQSVQFEGLGPIPAGERLLLNDWSATPNEIIAVAPDGSEESVVLRAYRVWSFGVSRDRQKIAFAAGDPNQEQNFGITTGDTIQPTFVYDAGCNSVGALSFGNLNDECHSFGPHDRYLYLCRRYDFTQDGMFKGYRVGRIELPTDKTPIADPAIEWLSADEAQVFSIGPQPIADESAFYYYRFPVGGVAGVMLRQVSDGSEVAVRERLGAPALSPDGLMLVGADAQQQGALISVDLASGTETLIANGQSLTRATFSPDGSRVAFLRFDSTASCSDVLVVPSDGSQADAPTLVHDCSVSGRFVTKIAWVAAE